MKTITLISLSSIILFSCAPNVPTNSNDLTLGAVQSKIYKGQSQSEVMDILGSPNIEQKIHKEEKYGLMIVSLQIKIQNQEGFGSYFSVKVMLQVVLLQNRLL